MKTTRILLVLFAIAFLTSCRYQKKCAAYDEIEVDQVETSVETD